MVDVYRSLNSFHRYENRFRDMRHFGNEILNFLDGLVEDFFCETTTVLKRFWVRSQLFVKINSFVVQSQRNICVQ